MTGEHVTDLLPELALGTLGTTELERATAHVSGCTDCAGELDELEAMMAELALALEPIDPGPELRASVLASIHDGRFAALADRFAHIFDVTVARAKELLGWIDDATKWGRGPAARTTLIHFQAGPACAGADTGFVRCEPGVQFPWHGHHGEERNLILQGACRDCDGSLYLRGDEFVKTPGTEHDFDAEGDVPLIFAVRVFSGVDFTARKP